VEIRRSSRGPKLISLDQPVFDHGKLVPGEPSQQRISVGSATASTVLTSVFDGEMQQTSPSETMFDRSPMVDISLRPHPSMQDKDEGFHGLDVAAVIFLPLSDDVFDLLPDYHSDLSDAESDVDGNGFDSAAEVPMAQSSQDRMALSDDDGISEFELDVSTPIVIPMAQLAQSRMALSDDEDGVDSSDRRAGPLLVLNISQANSSYSASWTSSPAASEQDENNQAASGDVDDFASVPWDSSSTLDSLHSNPEYYEESNIDQSLFADFDGDFTQSPSESATDMFRSRFKLERSASVGPPSGRSTILCMQLLGRSNSF